MGNESFFYNFLKIFLVMNSFVSGSESESFCPNQDPDAYKFSVCMDPDS